MQSAANLIGLLIMGLIVLGLARKPQIIRDFFGGLTSTLGLLNKA